MIIIPKEKPFLENLNTYYIDIPKFIEHCQGEIGTGGIYFSSNTIQGIIFFDKDTVINSILRIKGEESSGKNVVTEIIDLARKTNLNISVYFIDPARLYFFSHLTESEMIYKDLSSEFTDLEGLIKKMVSEKLTGYIEVTIGRGEKEAYLLFDRGIMIGGSYSWAGNDVNRSTENLNELIIQCREKGAYFNVAKLTLTVPKTKEPQETLPYKVDFIAVTEDLLNSTQELFLKQFGDKINFGMLLRKKFIEKSDKYPYLDPFAAEFTYKDNKVLYDGNSDPGEVLNGVFECLKEISQEIGILQTFQNEVSRRFEHYIKK